MKVRLLREALLWGTFLAGLWQSVAGPDPSGAHLAVTLLAVLAIVIAWTDWDTGWRPAQRIRSDTDA